MVNSASLTNKNIKQIITNLRSFSLGISNYLRTLQQDNGSFPARTFYGEIFAVLLWSYYENIFQDNITSSLNYYRHQDKSDPQFHWEFNNYALLKYFEKTKDIRISCYLESLIFKGTPVTNWTFLRAVCRFMARKQKFKGWVEIATKLLKFQKRGFIFDDYNVRSFQYHCFSTALLADIYELTGNRWLRIRFLKAVEFISHFIMPNGDTLYIGRGQQQIFGYGCLIFILAYAFKLTNKKEYLYHLEKVLDFISRFQRQDGFFPLVLRKEENGFPEVVDTKDSRYCGWYTYNNYFDYLPFFGYWIVRTADLLKGMEVSSNKSFEKVYNNGITYKDDNFLVFENKNYKAVVSKPGGYWTNDMPIPYICYHDESITPCYGGEQFAESIYSPEGIPLPFGKVGGENYFFRDRLNYNLRENTFIGENGEVKHKRSFEFKEREILIKDNIELYNCSFDEFYYFNILVFPQTVKENNGVSWVKGSTKAKIRLPKNSSIIKDRYYYSASGELIVLRNFEKPTEDSIYTEIVIEMESLR